MAVPELTRTERAGGSSAGDVQKHQKAGEGAQKALAFAKSRCVNGAQVSEVCQMTDTFIRDELGLAIAFPCSVSINEILCHYRRSENAEELTIKTGDLIKVELGACFEEHPALITSSFVLGEAAVDALKKEEVISRAKEALRMMIDAITPSTDNHALAAQVRKGCGTDGFQFVQGMMSHRLDKGVLSTSDGVLIVLNPVEGQAKNNPKRQFKNGDVWALDVAVCSKGCSGKVKPLTNGRPSIFARSGVTGALKLQTSRLFFSKASAAFGYFAFTGEQWASTTNQKGQAAKGRVALSECLSRQLVIPYEVLQAEEGLGSYTARFMATVHLDSQSGKVMMLTDPFPC